MEINKVVYGNKNLIDLTSDTIQADKLALGYTAHNAHGEIIVGTLRDTQVNITSVSKDYFGYLADLYTDTADDYEEEISDITTDVLTLTFKNSDNYPSLILKWPYINLTKVQADLSTLKQVILDNGIIFNSIPVRLHSASFTAADGTVTNIPVE